MVFCERAIFTQCHRLVFPLYPGFETYKFGKVAIAVDPSYTSQECPQCHAVVKKSLSQRTHICSCGCELQRAHASSIIILNRGKEQLEKIASVGHSESKSAKRKKSKKADRNAQA